MLANKSILYYNSIAWYFLRRETQRNYGETKKKTKTKKGGCMRTNNEFRKKKFLALFLSVLMVSSTAAGFAACDDTASSDSSNDSNVTESVQADKRLIKNGDFETFSSSVFDDEDNSNVIGTSASNWTRSVNSATSGSALSSKSASGIIDVTLENWKELTESKLGDVKVKDMSVEDAKVKWKDMSIKDKLDFYADYEDRDDDNEAEDLDFYKSYNIDNEDVPTCANPLTHDYKNGETQTNSKVLMIHNEYSNSSYTNIGTAQKYTSSSTVTVKAGTSAQFSVWVKTSDLQTATKDGEDENKAVGKGAYISITHSVGGKSLDPLEIKNIDTQAMDGLESTNGWAKYEFLLQGSSFADTTFNVVLGLGQTGGSDRYEYVNGYAFFDDVECKTISNDVYATSKVGYEELTFDKDKTFDAYTQTAKKYALNYYGSYSANSEHDVIVKANDIVNNAETSYTTEKNKLGVVYTSVKNPTDGSTTYSGLGFDTASDVKTAYANPAAIKADSNYATNDYLQAVYADHFENNKLFTKLAADNQETLVLLSAHGAAMTAKSAKTFTVKKDSYTAISFFVKTSDMQGVTGAGITLVETKSGVKTSFTALDTTNAATVDIDDETKDIYGGWQQCFFFVANETEEDELSFKLEFNLGPTAIVGSAASSYKAGFAAFTGFQTITNMSKEAYECAASGTYAKLVSLTGEKTSSVSDTGFDSVASTPTDAIEKGFANPKTYRGVYADSAYLGGEGSADINTNVNAGLLNKEHADTDEYKTLLNTMKTGATWDTLLGADANQPLVIFNPTAGKSYGFLGKSTSIAANTYTTVSLRVKANGTNAFVYLVDMDNDDNEVLSISRNRTYWYNDKGDVCVADPSENEESKYVAFKLQSNGLYKMNAAWAKANNVTLDETNYYANLAAYENVDGNLVLANNGVSYNYNDNWRNDGNDGIAFYDYNKTANTAYADSEKKVLVTDFSKVLKAEDYRYEEKTSGDFMFEVTADDNWAYVSFNIHTGDTAKNYRLEVWSGSREDGTVSQGSYAIFDSWSPTTIDEASFGTMTELRKESLTENEDYFDGVFSFYDTAKYLRYDASIDTNKVGNSYTDYLSSTYAPSLAYMKYASGENYELYADYATAEVAVAADVEEAEPEEEEEEPAQPNGADVALLAGSIVIAVVLVFAVVSLIVRKAMVKARRNRKTVTLTKAAPVKEKKAKPVRKTVTEKKDEDSPYND